MKPPRRPARPNPGDRETFPPTGAANPGDRETFPPTGAANPGDRESSPPTGGRNHTMCETPKQLLCTQEQRKINRNPIGIYKNMFQYEKLRENLVINKIIAIITENSVHAMEKDSTPSILHPSVFCPAARNGI
ncbi:MAG: hypothetical protein LBS04_03630 [Tannerellaceae bacterium]|nr:hypothetical protein [Tannerellaceae bacterium]